MEIFLPDYDPQKCPLIRVKTPELMERMFDQIFPGESKPIHHAAYYWNERKEDTAIAFVSGVWIATSWSIRSKEMTRFQLFDAEELFSVAEVIEQAFQNLI